MTLVEGVLSGIPSAVTARLLKGQLLLQDGRRDEALAVVREAASTNPASAEVQFALARMYAAREYRRRNSPSGIETFGDVTSFVARYDPDIDRALQTGAYARPVIS